MNNEFDPYREWLGIAASERPLNYYQLLALPDFEEDPQRIENAEMIEMAKVLRHEAGPDASLARQLCEELERAVNTLSDRSKKAAYDAQLRSQREGRPPVAATAPRVVVTASSVVEPNLPSVVKADRGHDFSDDLKLDDGVDEDLLDLVRQQREPAKVGMHPENAAIRSVAEAVHNEKIEASDEDPSDAIEQATSAQETKRSATVKDVLEQFLAPPPIELPKSRFRAIRIRPLLGAAIAMVLAFLIVWVAPAWWNSAPDAGPILARLQASEPQARIDAIDAFRYLDLDPEERTRHLLRVLKEDDNNAVRVAAANGLSTVEPVPELISELQQLASTEEHTGIKNTLTWIVKRSQQRLP